ncbi:MAG TPA: phosphodiesterase [Treponema sp.]|jgi:putative phosphoesterase|nr:phosphodiesterase [Treponema sp.]HBB43584.1 phosphodiesterase [Treponema sp.]HCA19772.1 phosphodiesterase [Treponema sp.]
MKWMIASDIHGSAKYCRMMLERFSDERADRLILLGDLLYHGPRNNLPEEYAPKAVIEMLNGVKEKILCVRGNCDTEVDQMVLDFPIMADTAVLDTGCGRLIYATHGHHACKENPLPMAHGSILLCGHTHVPACDEMNGFVYLNPGSVAIPKGESRHSYMTLLDRVFEWKDAATGEVYKSWKM